jgi:hypothetical protein
MFSCSECRCMNVHKTDCARDFRDSFLYLRVKKVSPQDCNNEPEDEPIPDADDAKCNKYYYVQIGNGKTQHLFEKYNKAPDCQGPEQESAQDNLSR